MLKRSLKLCILIVIYYKLSTHLGMMIIIIYIYDDKFDDSHHSKETDSNHTPNNPKPKPTQP